MVERCLIEINLLCAFMFSGFFGEFSVNNIKTLDLIAKKMEKSLMIVGGENIKFLTANYSNCNVKYVLCFVYVFILQVLQRDWIIFFHLIIEYMKLFCLFFLNYKFLRFVLDKKNKLMLV